jgi:hypothetical protein
MPPNGVLNVYLMNLLRVSLIQIYSEENQLVLTRTYQDAKHFWKINVGFIGIYFGKINLRIFHG